MNRFCHFNARAVSQLQKNRARCARRSLWLTVGMMGIGALLLTSVIRRHVADTGSSFLGIPYRELPGDSPVPRRAGLLPPAASPPLYEEPELALPESAEPLPEMYMVDDSALSETTPPDLFIPPMESWVPEDTPPRQAPPGVRPRRAAAVATPRTEPSIRAATPLHTPHPGYPELMRQQRREGDVRISISIDASGYPTDIHIHGDVHPEFATHTRRWILKHWRFTPASQDSMAIASTMTTTIRYRLAP